ncbi:MAG TPA: hypothetical protein VFR42_07365, partial [Candidatus Acidoferrum sp.]|nr:hypothetical protein [Candidatus Acidoferrum sp.]
LFVVGTSIFAAYVGLGIGSSSAAQLAAGADHRQQRDTPPKSSNLGVATAVAAPTAPDSTSDVKPVRRVAGKGPYYVDFRARTAASYGHAFVWFGKTSEKQVEVAGLHPAGDTLPYVLGHLTWVPSETGASYGDLDVQYLTASYRVYLSEPDARKVFAYIKHLQATSPVWNAETTNCTAFIGRIASFMGLKTPFHLLKPEEYVNQLKALNDGRQTVQLAPDT